MTFERWTILSLLLILMLVLFRPQQEISIEMPEVPTSHGRTSAPPSESSSQGEFSMNETLQAMMRRRSNRNFLPDMPDDAAIRAIVEAGRAAPSAFDSQARYFAVIQDRQLLDEMNNAVKEVSATLEGEFYQRVGNDENYDVFYRAPVLIVVAGDESSLLIEQDCAAANENMLIAAESLGLGACWIGFTRYVFDGPRGNEFRERLHIPEGYAFYCSAVIGHKTVERHDEKIIKGNTTHFFD